MHRQLTLQGFVIADTEINQTFEDFKEIHGNEAKTACVISYCS